jgi:hypothetical protein
LWLRIGTNDPLLLPRPHQIRVTLGRVHSTTEAATETLSRRYARMPTAAIARIDFDTDLWVELFDVGGHLAWVQKPRELEAETHYCSHI